MVIYWGSIGQRMDLLTTAAPARASGISPGRTLRIALAALLVALAFNSTAHEPPQPSSATTCAEYANSAPWVASKRPVEIKDPALAAFTADLNGRRTVEDQNSGSPLLMLWMYCVGHPNAARLGDISASAVLEELHRGVGEPNAAPPAPARVSREECIETCVAETYNRALVDLHDNLSSIPGGALAYLARPESQLAFRNHCIPSCKSP